MTVGAKLAAFAAILAASFGVGAVVGAAVGPIEINGGHDDHTPVDHSVHDDGMDHGDVTTEP